MPAYSFQAQFVKLIQDGSKHHTIRRRRKYPTKPGDVLKLYTGMRTMKCLLISVAQCASVVPVKIYPEMGRVVLDGRMLSLNDTLRFAVHDGFANHMDFFAFFKRKKEDVALACDIYTTVEDNLWALCRTLDALRQIERDGSPSLINRAFKGFAALPDPNERKWWEALNLSETASNEEIKQAYFNLARQYHPDNKETGNVDLFRQIQQVYELAMGRGA